ILSDGSSVHEIPGTGSSVNIYPNPVSDVLTIEVDALGNKEFVVELISPIGQLLHNSTINTFERTVGEINVQRYPSGIYLLRVSSQGKWVTLKIVID
ncbi:MAG TPA: T9SS type A sorting domain-containing protein, partial [Tenuifilaceae bacterium]|nr:T9SS type A sorting domain-containing protein [Tenuifilaceae bacterium]